MKPSMLLLFKLVLYVGILLAVGHATAARVRREIYEQDFQAAGLYGVSGYSGSLHDTFNNGEIVIGSTTTLEDSKPVKEKVNDIPPVTERPVASVVVLNAAMMQTVQSANQANIQSQTVNRQPYQDVQTNIVPNSGASSQGAQVDGFSAAEGSWAGYDYPPQGYGLGFGGNYQLGGHGVFGYGAPVGDSYGYGLGNYLPEGFPVAGDPAQNILADNYHAVGIPQPVPVAVPVAHHVPVPVQVPVPVTVEKSVHVPYLKPVPYPVEKPYPVHIVKRVPVPVPHPYPVPYPVYKTRYIVHTKKHGIGLFN